MREIRLVINAPNVRDLGDTAARRRMWREIEDESVAMLRGGGPHGRPGADVRRLASPAKRRPLRMAFALTFGALAVAICAAVARQRVRPRLAVWAADPHPITATLRLDQPEDRSRAAARA